MAPQIFVKHKKIFENVFEEKNPTKFATIWGREKVNHVTFSEKEEYLSFVGFHSVQWDVVQLPHFLWWSCNKIKDNYWNEAFVPSPERIIWNILESKTWLKILTAGQNSFGWIEVVDENRQKHSYLWLKKTPPFPEWISEKKDKKLLYYAFLPVLFPSWNKGGLRAKMRTKALFNSSLYLAVSTSSLARPVRSLQSNAIFNQPSACHFTAEEIGKKMERRKTSWGRTNWRQRKGPQESKVLEKVPCEEKRPG